MATQAQRREATRKTLIETARQLIVTSGIVGTTTRRILDTAGISKGAMYHHFDSLEDLIAVVYEMESKGAIHRAVAKQPYIESPFEALQQTCLAWLAELKNQEVARILIVEGPAAIGMQRCQNIEAEHSMAQMKRWLEEAKERGEIETPSIELTTRMLNAMLSEAALFMVKLNADDRALTQAEETFLKFANGLKV